MKGYSQIPGQDFDLMFSLVVKFMMLRVLLSLSTHENWELHQVDVMGVYLQGDLNEEIYMTPLEGIKLPGKAGWSW